MGKWLDRFKHVGSVELKNASTQTDSVDTVSTMSALSAHESKETAKNELSVKVMCKNCRNFTRDKIGFGDGIGNCEIECDKHGLHGGIPTYPNVKRICGGYCPIEKTNS